MQDYPAESSFLSQLSIRSGPSHSTGSVILELVIVLPILVSLFIAMTDYSFLLREEIILSDAARTAIRTVVAAPDFEGDSDSEDSVAVQQLAYATERFDRAIEAARYLVAANNLNPDHYNYNALNVVRADAEERFRYDTIQFNISSRGEDRFFVFPENSFKVCVGAGAIVSGLVLADNFSVVDPVFDPQCSPETIELD